MTRNAELGRLLQITRDR